MKTIQQIEKELEENRKLIIAKIKQLLAGYIENSKLEIDLNKVDEPTYVYYSDRHGYSHEGTVVEVWIENGSFHFEVEPASDDDGSGNYELSENNYDHAIYAHRWLIGILHNICDMLGIDEDTIEFEESEEVQKTQVVNNITEIISMYGGFQLKDVDAKKMIIIPSNFDLTFSIDSLSSIQAWYAVFNTDGEEVQNGSIPYTQLPLSVLKEILEIAKTWEKIKK